jgi:hypothetical protein
MLEREVFRLVSGGHGQYDEKVSGIFRKWNMYTFKIEWQSSTLGTDTSGGDPEGPDYDYTMKVQPVATDPLLGIIDSFDPATGFPEAGYQLLGEHSNFQNFETVSDTKRVAIETAYIDLAVDANLNSKIESLPDGIPPGNGWEKPVHSVADRDMENASPPRPTIIDVNNNNTDSGNGQSPTKDEVDNRNASLDTQADRDEHVASADGHAFARLRIWANAVKGYGLSWKQAQTSTHFLKLTLPDAGDDQILRVYDWDTYSAEEETPVVVLGPAKTSHIIDVENFFRQGEFGPGTERSNWHQDLFIEGLTYGTARIRLELINVATGQSDKTDEVLVTVNVDRVEQPPTDVAGEKDARHLRGVTPHHLGIRKQGIHYEPVRAIRGDIVVRVPRAANGSQWRTRHTPMAGRLLRQQVGNSQQESAGSSIWVGLKQTDSSGTFQWVQTGLRWVMENNREYGSYPAAYIESGDSFVSPFAKSLAQGSAETEDQLGAIVLVQNALPLSTWDTAPIKLSFVMFKPSTFNSEGREDGLEKPWFVIFRDERPGQTITETSFIRLSVGKPVLKASVPSTVADQMEIRYRTQTMQELDVLFESNQTIAFAPGTPGEKAWIGNLHFAPSLLAGHTPPPELGSGSKAVAYSWALATFAWQDVALSSGEIVTEIKSGRSLANGVPEDGSTAHPSWHAAVSGTTLQIWDDRPPDFHQNTGP